MVGGNIFYFPFHNIWDVILPIDFHIFQDGENHQPEYHHIFCGPWMTSTLPTSVECSPHARLHQDMTETSSAA